MVIPHTLNSTLGKKIILSLSLPNLYSGMFIALQSLAGIYFYHNFVKGRLNLESM